MAGSHTICLHTPTQQIHLPDLQQLAVLGAGGFGRVTLVKNKVYASSVCACARVFAFAQLERAALGAGRSQCVA